MQLTLLIRYHIIIKKSILSFSNVIFCNTKLASIEEKHQHCEMVILNNPSAQRRQAIFGNQEGVQQQHRFKSGVGNRPGGDKPTEAIIEKQTLVCVVQYRAEATCWVQRRGKVNIAVCYLFNSVMLRSVHCQEGFCNPAATGFPGCCLLGSKMARTSPAQG